MNLEQYKDSGKAENKGGGGNYWKFKTDGTVVMRFMHKTGADINVINKKWNQATQKFESFPVGSEEGTDYAQLDTIIYTPGQAPERVLWEQSAKRVVNEFLPLMNKFKPISQGVWEVTCRNAGQMDVKYSMFPVMDANEMTFPIIDKPARPEGTQAPKPKNAPAPAPQAVAAPAPQPAPVNPTPAAQVHSTTGGKKYWEQ